MSAKERRAGAFATERGERDSRRTLFPTLLIIWKSSIGAAVGLVTQNKLYRGAMPAAKPEG